MDPNEALARLRALWDAQDYLTDDETDEVMATFDALDQWIAKGGFLPEAWKR